MTHRAVPSAAAVTALVLRPLRSLPMGELGLGFIGLLLLLRA